ncbi:MgtC/SapB family protein [Halovenus rubra]|uniref:MgtC/SapB family protein n=2 Tax=Halovenus rubra TaxID=869890 RepID=A0ACC7DWD4_9EURY|nr:MgtC/SapB family protein [Halovenus rubra]
MLDVSPVQDVFAVPDLLVSVTIAIAIGGLIGLERERMDKFAGVRTMALLAGTAPAVVAVADRAELPMLVVVYLTLVGTLALAIAYVRFRLRGDELGFTTTVTVFLVGVLGLLVGYGLLFEATSIGIITAVLLAEKEVIHSYINRLTDEELSDSMKLVALVFILYPILPTEPIDPYGVVNLREVLVFAIFVLLIQFGAYISMRQFGGSTGLQVTGVLAGSANSLATAGVLARMVNQSRKTVDAASSALLLASGSMIVRNAVIASVLAVPLLWVLWLPVAVMLVLTVGLAYLSLVRGQTEEEYDFDFDSPFSFVAAGKFALAYVGIVLASVAGEELFGQLGLYATSFAGGLVSSAAVAVSAATLFSDGSIEAEPAAGMILLAIVASLVAKIVLVELLNDQMRRQAILPMVVIGLSGLLVFVVL